MEYLIYCNGDNKSYNWLGKDEETPRIFKYPQHSDGNIKDTNAFTLTEAGKTDNGELLYYISTGKLYLAPEQEENTKKVVLTDNVKDAGEWLLKQISDSENPYMYNIQLDPHAEYSYLRGDTKDDNGKLRLEPDNFTYQGCNWLILGIVEH